MPAPFEAILDSGDSLLRLACIQDIYYQSSNEIDIALPSRCIGLVTGAGAEEQPRGFTLIDVELASWIRRPFHNLLGLRASVCIVDGGTSAAQDWGELEPKPNLVGWGDFNHPPLYFAHLTCFAMPYPVKTDADFPPLRNDMLLRAARGESLFACLVG
jgi:hypothetical protein